MVKSICLAKDFVAITELYNNRTLLRFSKEDIYMPVMTDDEENPQPTGEYVKTDFVRFTEEIIKGEPTVDVVRNFRIKELTNRDNSTEVNEFFYNGKSMWFDKVTRACIAYSIQSEKDNGATTTVLFDNDNEPHTLPVDLALQLFGALEVYAKQCYNATQTHLAALKGLDTVEALLEYNILSGYPEKLNIGESNSSEE